MRPANWLRIGKGRREGNEVAYPLSIDEEEAIREGQRRLREAAWSAEEFSDALRQAALVFGLATSDFCASDDPALGPDAARWTPEDDG